MTRKPNAVPALQEGTVNTIILDDGRKNRSITGHVASDDFGGNDILNFDRLAVTDEVCEVIDVITTPDTYPELFRRRVKCLMISGLSQAEAEEIVSSTPLKLELFYDIGRGSFAIDAEAVGNTPLYNPYTGKEITDKT